MTIGETPRWRVKDSDGDDLIDHWKRFHRSSNEYAAVEIIEQLERELAALKRPGYVMAPREPTDAMLDAMAEKLVPIMLGTFPIHIFRFIDAYRAMIAAAENSNR